MYHRTIIALCASILTFNMVSADDHSKEIAEIKQGIRTEAQASWWGYDAKNATKCLQQAINSGAKKLIIDNVGSEWLVSPIQLAGNQELVIDAGVTVRALPGSFKGSNDCLLTANNKGNIIIRGKKGAVLKMNRKDYQNQKLYKRAEWRHALSLRGCNNVAIKNLTIMESGGDGIYIAGSLNKSGQNYCKDVIIDNVTSTQNHRQGLTVISGENILIKNSVFSNTFGTDPATGIDFEPNDAHQRLVNCIVENCVMSGNAGAGIDICPTQLDATTLPVSLTCRNCKLTGNRYGIKMLVRSPRKTPVKGKAEFINCQLSANWLRTTWINDTGDAFKIVFRNCTLDNRNAKANSALILNSVITKPLPLGGIRLTDTAIIDRPGKPPIQLLKRPGTSFTNDIGGNITVNGKNFDINSYVRKKCRDLAEMKELMPAILDIDLLQAPAMDIGKTSTPPRIHFRYHVGMLLEGLPGKPIIVTLTPQKYGSAKNNVNVNLFDPTGKKIKRLSLKPDGKPFKLEFVPKIKGVYKLNIHSRGQKVAINSNNPGQGMTPIVDGRLHLVAPHGKLYFSVPAGLTKLRLLIAADPNEYVTVALRNAKGRAVQTERHYFGKRLLKVTRPANSPAEIWSIDLMEAKEDVHIQFISPLQPVTGFYPELLYTFKERN